MRAFIVEDNQLTLSTVATPEVVSNEILIQTHAFGINRADLLQKAGHYPPLKGESDILGLEVVGQVAHVGAAVERWNVGDRVMALTPGGGYAEYTKVCADHVIAVPASIKLDQAAVIMETFLTAYQALVWEGSLVAGDKVLIHGGASGVGCAAIQLARYSGAHVAITASSEEKRQLCQGLGAELCFDYRHDDWSAKLKQAWSGVDLVIDIVGGEHLSHNLKLMNMDGRIIQLAMLGGRYATVDMARLLQHRVTLKASTLRNRSDAYKTRLVTEFQQACWSGLSDGTLRAVIDSVYSPESANEAHQKMESNANLGKLVVRW